MVHYFPVSIKAPSIHPLPLRESSEFDRILGTLRPERCATALVVRLYRTKTGGKFEGLAKLLGKAGDLHINQMRHLEWKRHAADRFEAAEGKE